MRVLIVQTSPFSDIVDTLPALTDAQHAKPGIEFDWVVESAYQEVPAWHPAVKNVIPTAMRRWRKHFWQTLHSPEWRQFKTQLRRQHYDLVIDCQSLIKSAAIGKLVKAPVVGVHKTCAREKAATWFYHRQLTIDTRQPKPQRLRSLFAMALGYKVKDEDLDFGIDKARFCGGLEESANVVFIHGASREERLYAEAGWQAVIRQLSDYDVRVRLPWGSELEKSRAERLATDNANVEVLPKLNLQGLACVLAQAKAVVAVDTGLGHLSAALGVPTVSLYNFPASNTTVTIGKNLINLHPEQNNTAQSAPAIIAPDLVAPEDVVAQLYKFLPARKSRAEARAW